MSVLGRRLQELLHGKTVLLKRDSLVRTVDRSKTGFQASCLVCQSYQKQDFSVQKYMMEGDTTLDVRIT